MSVTKAKKLLVLGPAGSYLDGLAKSLNYGIEIIYGENFASMIAQAELSPDTAVLLPIKNTLKGTLSEVVGAFQSGKLVVESSAKLDVSSNIMGLGSLNDAKVIAGKDVALKQITKFMPNLERKVMSSTSAAGQYIKETGDKTILSVGSAEQAKIYGLKILAKGAHDNDGLNRTTVLVTRGRNGWSFDPETIKNKDEVHGTAIMRVSDSDKSGSLYNALGEFAKRQINLLNIESLNIRGTELSEFFITFSGLGSDIKDLATNKQVENQIHLDVLGVYSKPKIYPS